MVKIYKSNEYSPTKLYEGILQSYLFCGFPAVIESFKIFRKYYKQFEINKTKYNVSDFRTKGKSNCKLIYKKNYKKLIENMNSYSLDLKEWMIIEGYGKVLGRKGLTLLEREYINVTILCTRYYENQLHSHLKGCMNLGASRNNLVVLLNNLQDQVKSANIKKGITIIDKLN
jgi:4-carboxymuconolactone decarboxylase